MSSAQENMACVLRYTTWNDQQSKRVHTFNPVRRTDGLRMPFASCYLPQELRWPELVSIWRRGSYMAVFNVKELHMDRKLYMVAIAGQKYMQSWESQADICAWRESSACCMKPSFMCWLTSTGQSAHPPACVLYIPTSFPSGILHSKPASAELSTQPIGSTSDRTPPLAKWPHSISLLQTI